MPNFQIQLSDGTGSGVDNTTVSSASFAFYMDVPAGQNPANFPQDLLTAGNQYVFTYDSLNDIARFTPTSGGWSSGHTYTIVVANSGANAIEDLSANPLQANSTATNTVGQTLFQISIQQTNFGTAPAPYPDDAGRKRCAMPSSTATACSWAPAKPFRPMVSPMSMPATDRPAMAWYSGRWCRAPSDR